MVQDRKEPTFSSIKPERDEIATHQSRMSKRPASGGGRPPPRREAPAASGSSGMGVAALLVALIGAGVAGYSMWQNQQAQQELADAEDRLMELEARLNLTNNESDQSVSAIHDKLEWADSEIRKLWGVSNDTNRKAIAANKELAAQASSEAEAAKEVAESQEAALKAATTRTNQQQLEITQLSEEIQLSGQKVEQLNKLSEELEVRVEKLVQDLEGRVAGNEEAIRAIDSFRRTANADIQELKQRFNP